MPEKNLKEKKKDQEKDHRCSFCGRTDREARAMVIASGAGKSLHICDRCVGQCNRIIGDVLRKKGVSWEWEWKGGGMPGRGPRMQGKAATPREVHARLDEHVIGQEKAKKILAVAVCNHRKRLMCGGKVKKSNILLAGPTGCGKTKLAETMAGILDVPFITADATSLTQSGYVGDSADAILQRLLSAAGGDLERAQKGIVYLDEFDKLGRRNGPSGTGRDIGGEGVQQELLKIIEGSVVYVRQPQEADGMPVLLKEIPFDTKDVLFICGGAFSGLTMDEGKESVVAGFRALPDPEDAGKAGARKVTQETLRKAGIIPELAGRLPVIAELEALGVDDLVRILCDVKGSIISEYRALFAADGIRLEFTDGALRKVAELAAGQGTGARGLRAVLEEVMLDLMYDMPSSGKDACCTVTEGMVLAAGSAMTGGVRELSARA